MRGKVWSDPRTIIGASDAGAHLDTIDTFAFTTQLLGRGVREKKLIGLEEAVHQLTDVPARLYGLKQAHVVDGDVRLIGEGLEHLDVFAVEPPEDQALLNLPNLLATPHSGACTVDARLAMGRNAMRGLMDNFIPEPGAPPIEDR